MTESKKPAAKPKQVSIAAFFSPKAASKKAVAEDAPKGQAATPVKAPKQTASAEAPEEINLGAFKTPSPAGGAKRQRAAKSDAKDEKKKPRARKNVAEDLNAAADGGKQPKGRRGRASARTKAAPPVRVGVSPHERGPDDDDDLDDDDDDDDTEVSTRHATEETADQVEVVEEETKDDAESKVVHEEEDEVELTDLSTPPPAKTKARRTPKTASVAASTSAAAQSRKSAKKDAASPAPTKNLSPQKPPQPTVVAPLDPVVRARVATYQQKIDDLTQLCDRLAQSKAADDVVLQEIYGLGMDVGLDSASDSLRDEISDYWRKLAQDPEPTISTSMKHFVARAIQSRSDGLTELVKRISTLLHGTSTHSVPQTGLLALEMEIKMLAQRTSYGARPSKANLYEDTTSDALWCWEVNNIELHFSEESQKTIKRMRKQRKRTGAQLKSLSRVVQLLHQSPIDEVKVSNEEAKIGKFVSQVESELQKARDKEKKEEEKARREQEKAHAVEEKKRLEHERLLAKEEEKRKKEEEAEAERQLAEKRRKSLVSYFRSIDTVGDATSAGATGGGRTSSAGSVSVAICAKQEKMSRMDEEISYLVKDSSTPLPSSPPSSRSGASLLRRNREIVTARVGSWSSRQHRDKNLGAMKFLQFHENYRPAYYGTFSKRSKVFRRGRRPFAQYPKFDYSVDSDEEWEEEEPGESLSDVDSDADDEDDEDQLDYGDDWLAYEDEVEYVDGENERDDEDVVIDDDGDGGDIGDDEGSRNVGSSESSRKKRRRKRVAAQSKKQKLTKLVPEVRGPFVCYDAECSDHLNGYIGHLLVDVPDFVSPLLRKAQEREDAAATAAAAAERPGQPKENGGITISTPAVRKKAKNPKTVATKASTQPGIVSQGGTPASDATKTTHKPPVKRKIAPQLVSASAEEEKSKSDVDRSSAEKKPRTTPTENGSAPQKHVKSGLSSWLKTPTPAISSGTTETVALDSTALATSPDSKAPAEDETQLKAPIEI